MELMQQTGETLAGRIAFLELSPIGVLEVTPEEYDRLWNRGGFPDSLLASNDAKSNLWRQNFIRTYLERDVPQLGPRIPAETLRRFWVMLAHIQGGPLNAASLSRGLGVDGKTVAKYLDLMVDLLLVRRLAPWHRNIGKRLVKSPKIYVRDSGVVHALLGLGSKEDVLGHPVAGHSWEGFVVENLVNVAAAGTEASYYRASGGAEIDLILTLGGRKPWAIEIKRSLEPKVGRGFHEACADIKPEAKFVVYPGEEEFPLPRNIRAVNVADMVRLVIENRGDSA